MNINFDEIADAAEKQQSFHNLAETLCVYYVELTLAGFTEAQAMAVVWDWQRSALIAAVQTGDDEEGTG